MRKTMIALAAVAFSYAMLPTTSADARPRGGFVGARSHVAFKPAFHHRRFFGATCWRWQPTPWGWQRVWVCG